MEPGSFFFLPSKISYIFESDSLKEIGFCLLGLIFVCAHAEHVLLERLPSSAQTKHLHSRSPNLSLFYFLFDFLYCIHLPNMCWSLNKHTLMKYSYSQWCSYILLLMTYDPGPDVCEPAMMNSRAKHLGKTKLRLCHLIPIASSADINSNQPLTHLAW